ncbi:50S ribosomal protein L4 [bacterium]|nr:50S ribosomal protein L4 [bacterium]
MAEIDLYNSKGKVIDKVLLPDEIFKVKVKVSVLNEVVKMHLANCRMGTACTKTKGEVSGGGSRPWRQKGTGRARAGSNRSPLWRHGGVTFGPRPRNFKYSIPKKKKKLALKGALSNKFEAGELLVVDTLELKEPKTRIMSKLLDGLKVQKTSLIVIAKIDKLLLRATNNIPGLKVILGKDLNVYDVLKYKKIIITKEAVSMVKEVLG